MKIKINKCQMLRCNPIATRSGERCHLCPVSARGSRD